MSSERVNSCNCVNFPPLPVVLHLASSRHLILDSYINFFLISRPQRLGFNWSRRNRDWYFFMWSSYPAMVILSLSRLEMERLLCSQLPEWLNDIRELLSSIMSSRSYMIGHSAFSISSAQQLYFECQPCMYLALWWVLGKWRWQR